MVTWMVQLQGGFSVIVVERNKQSREPFFCRVSYLSLWSLFRTLLSLLVVNWVYTIKILRIIDWEKIIDKPNRVKVLIDRKPLTVCLHSYSVLFVKRTNWIFHMMLKSTTRHIYVDDLMAMMNDSAELLLPSPLVYIN